MTTALRRPHFKRSSRLGFFEPYLYLLPASVFLLLTFFYPIFQIFRLSLFQETELGLPQVSLTYYELVLQ
ncbi:MAG: hypothetical protein L0Z70_11480, partial [Chloroflexi bacterium]|nr:hypothetical protein [Chloroflexota bacterium]